jgi:hypothetical protein
MPKVQHVRVSRFGTAHLRERSVIYMVDYEDGTSGELSLPVALIGKFIELSHRAVLNEASNQGLELNVLRIVPARNDRDQLVLQLDTAEAHSILCIVPQEEVRPLQEKLDNFDDLPLLRWSDPN